MLSVNLRSGYGFRKDTQNQKHAASCVGLSSMLDLPSAHGK